MIKKTVINFEAYAQKLSERNLTYSENNVYIFPEGCGEEEDLLNTFTPDLHKILKRNSINSVVVKHEKYAYLSLKDAGIILPFIVNVTSGVVVAIIAKWINDNIPSNKKLKIKFITKKNEDTYTEFEIEGSPTEAIDALNQIKDHINE